MPLACSDVVIEKASLRLDAAGPSSLQERGARVKAPAKGPTAHPPRAPPSAQDLALLAKYDMFGQLLQAAAAAPQAQARPWPRGLTNMAWWEDMPVRMVITSVHDAR